MKEERVPGRARKARASGTRVDKERKAKRPKREERLESKVAPVTTVAR